MNKIKWFLMVLSVFNMVGVQAQNINLEFPYFAGKTFEFKIVQGDKQIVVQKDTIPVGGKLQLVLPDKYKGYKGMAMWHLTNNKNGGGLDFVINNESFSVSCLDSVPNETNIFYKNTKENIFLNTNYQEQQVIFAKHDAMLYATKAYPKNHVLYPVFAKEYETIQGEYNEFIKRTKASPLYAARFREIVNLTMGIGTIITQDEKLKAENINDIITNQLDFGALYTSNHWSGIINNWVQMHNVVIRDDVGLIHDIKSILNRLPNNLLYTEFVISLTKELTKLGKDSVITALISTIKNSNQLLNYDGVLGIYQKTFLDKAPNLVIKTKSNQKDITNEIDLSKQKTKYSLIIFYESGCGFCEQTLVDLRGKYKDLMNQGITIYSISADTDPVIFKETSSKHPWGNDYCDLMGFNGVNFKNYSVIGTPMMYLVNKKGIIVSIMSSSKELFDWIKNH